MADCEKLLKEAANGGLSDDELIEILEELQNERRFAEEGLEDVETRLFEAGAFMASEAEKAATIEIRARYQNALAESRMMEQAARADAMTDNPALGIHAALVGVNAPFEGAGRSVDGLTVANMNAYAGGLIADLKRADLYGRFNNMSEETEREVALALSELNGGAKADVSREARDLAKIMHKYQTFALDRENRAGAYIRRKAGYVTRQSHDPMLLGAEGREAWKAFVVDLIDWVKMKIAPENRAEFLDNAYTELLTGVRMADEISTVDRAFKGPGNLARKESASRVIEFKSPEAWLEYNRRFGKGTLAEAYMNGLHVAARATALMTNLGTNPKAMVDRVVAQLEMKYRNDPKKLAQLRGNVSGVNIAAALDEVTGDVNIGAHTKVARIASAFRALMTLSRLGAAGVSALSDVAFIAANRKFQGRTIVEAWQDAFTAVFAGMKGGDRRVMADMMGAGLEMQLGDFMSRFNASDHIAGTTSKLMAALFKLNLLGPWTDANKRGVTFMIARDFAMQSGKPFDALPADFQRVLRIYGLTGKKWEVARQAVRKGPDGREYIMPGDVDDVRGAVFTGMSEYQQQRLRDEVREGLFNLYASEADFAVPSPGARERAILRRGYRPGTVAGEAIRFVTQFKSFGVTALTKVGGRQVYGDGAKTMREQLARGVGANLGLVNAIVGTTVLGYYVLQAKEILKGRNPRPPTAKTMIAAMAQGGGLGIYGDFLFGQANRYGGGTLETVVGPGIGTAAELVDLLQRARGVVEGGEADLRGDTLRLVKQNVPFANLFYTKQAMDYLIWYQLQETINPGYLARMERRVKRENDQTFWLPPSKYIQRGGGFK